MRKTRGRIVLKTLGWVLGAFVVLSMLAPLAVYQHAIGLVDGLPEKPATLLSEGDAGALWASKEKCNTKECTAITPYWMYHWLVIALVNDYVQPIDADSPYFNVSKMASLIASTHMRKGRFKRKGMLWWHITYACLGIWIQRNWTANEIASKYKEIHA